MRHQSRQRNLNQGGRGGAVTFTDDCSKLLKYEIQVERDRPFDGVQYRVDRFRCQCPLIVPASARQIFTGFLGG